MTTLLDYPDEIASIIFIKGCNFRCGFCHNTEIVNMTNPVGGIGTDDAVKKLRINKEKHHIDHVVITGGEPTIHHNELIRLMIMLKNIGFSIKLDTNGMNSQIIGGLIDAKLVDYIAMDIKTALNKESYSKVVGLPEDKIDINNILISINKIIYSGIKYEFRTTVVKTYHTMDDLIAIANWKFKNMYFQQFRPNENMFDKNLEAYSNFELKSMIYKLKETYPDVHLRGV